jgi:hypothetical protein
LACVGPLQKTLLNDLSSLRDFFDHVDQLALSLGSCPFQFAISDFLLSAWPRRRSGFEIQRTDGAD